VNADQSGNVAWNAAPSQQQSFAVSAAGDTTAPVITNVEPGNEPGGWTSIACSVAGNTGKVCATVTDNVGVTSVTMTLTKSGGRCWDGSAGSSGFGNTTCAPVTMSSSGGTWRPANALVRDGSSGAGKFTDTSYTLTITAKDAAGNTTTATRTFSVNGS
jgi:hypothetical protein